MTRNLTAALILAGAALTGPALAQTATAPAAAPEAAAAAPAPAAVSADMQAAAYTSARNQLGVLTYCKDKGFIDGASIAVQQKMLTMLPAGDTAAGDEAEAKGKAGTVSAMGQEMSLAEGAKAQGTTEEALCKQMDTMLQQAGSQLPS